MKKQTPLAHLAALERYGPISEQVAIQVLHGTQDMGEQIMPVEQARTIIATLDPVAASKMVEYVRDQHFSARVNGQEIVFWRHVRQWVKECRGEQEVLE